MLLTEMNELLENTLPLKSLQFAVKRVSYFEYYKRNRRPTTKDLKLSSNPQVGHNLPH